MEHLDLYIEILATLLSVGFLIGVIHLKVWAWPLGALSSGLSMWLFVRSGLYSETLLYFIYVLVGFYGWWEWTRADKQNSNPGQVDLVDVPWRKQHYLVWGFPAALLLAYLMHLIPGASMPLFDSFTTVFALIATYQEAKRIRTAFHYWIPVNIATTVLYLIKGYEIYGALMVFYSVMSVYGYLRWRKKTVH